MARPPLSVGTYGRISSTKQASGSWRASARIRDADGQTRTVQAFATTAHKAETKLREKLQGRLSASGELGGVTPAMHLSVLLDSWLVEIELSDRRVQTVERYRSAVRVICAPQTGIGGLRISECTTSRVDRWLKQIASDRPALAKLCKVALVGGLGMAVRHGALLVNPVREVAPIRAVRKPVRTLTTDERRQLRARVALWESGAQMPEDVKPRQKGGQARATGLVNLLDVALGTGARIGKLLALRWSDIDLSADPPLLTVAGTVAQADAGLIRQAHAKTAAGFRTVLLPQFVVNVLMQMQVDATPNAGDLVFPSSTGTLRSEANLNRQWREARGPEFDWVTSHIPKDQCDSDRQRGDHRGRGRSARTFGDRRHQMSLHREGDRRAGHAADPRSSGRPLTSRLK